MYGNYGNATVVADCRVCSQWHDRHLYRDLVRDVISNTAKLARRKDCIREYKNRFELTRQRESLYTLPMITLWVALPSVLSVIGHSSIDYCTAREWSN